MLCHNCNAAISGTRENYDEISFRIIRLCVYGGGGYMKYANIGPGLSDNLLQVNAR